MKEFRESVIKQVQNIGQEVIDRAGDIVGERGLAESFDIYLHFPLNEKKPTIEVRKTFISRRDIN